MEHSMRNAAVASLRKRPYTPEGSAKPLSGVSSSSSSRTDCLRMDASESKSLTTRRRSSLFAKELSTVTVANSKMTSQDKFSKTNSCWRPGASNWTSSTSEAYG